MLAVTDEAASAISRMTNTDVYPEAGLRISTVNEDRFILTLVPHPGGDDVSVDAAGSNLYLDDAAAEALDTATLDVDSESWGAERFLVTRT